MDAVQMKNTILAAMAVIGTFIANELGGWDDPMKILVALMLVDYLTGVMVAAVWHNSPKSSTGTLDSKAGFKGLLKKGAIVLVVWIGVMLDKAMGTSYIRTALILFFVGNEGLSLLENLGLMGVPFPEFLKRALEALREQGDKGGGNDAEQPGH